MRGRLTLLFAASWARSLITFFVGLGALGPFFLEALDSSFFYVPLANELLLFELVHSSSARWMWIVYALSGAAGTVVGVLALDFVVRRMGARGVERVVGHKRFERLKKKVEQHTGWVVFIAAMLPPPFPFRFTIMTASALQCERGRMLISVFTGRAIRFAVEALLILYFGRRFLDLMHSETFTYVIYGLTLAAIAGSALTIYKLITARREEPKGGRRKATAES